MIDAQVSKIQGRHDDEGWNYSGALLTSHIRVRRERNAPRVVIHLAPPPFPLGCRDFIIDGIKIGGNSSLSDTMTSPYLGSDEFKSTLCILHENRFTWDEINEFIWIARVDTHHLQLRQIELMHELTSNVAAAKVFYGSLYKGIDELAHELIKSGIDVSGIFLAGGSALLLDPANFPLQTNPRARIANRMSKPKDKLNTAELAETLSDVDIIVFSQNNRGDDLSNVLSRSYGKIFFPLGFEPQKIIDEFPNRIGLDVILCEQDNLSDMVMSAEGSPNQTVPVDLVRYPNIRKPAQSRIAPGLITEMIPLWWNPDRQETRDKYHRALQKVAKAGNLEPYLISCSRASKARDIIYSDAQVKAALWRRWDMMKEGEFMENLFDLMFKAPKKK